MINNQETVKLLNNFPRQYEEHVYLNGVLAFERCFDGECPDKRSFVAGYLDEQSRSICAYTRKHVKPRDIVTVCYRPIT